MSLLGASGCQTFGTTDQPVEAPAEIPSADELVRAHNQRVDGLERIKSRIVAQIDGESADGSPLREQAEGTLLIEQPERAAVLLGKLGKTGLILGTDGELYWWIDAISGDEPQAMFGRVALATPERTGAMGLPVHPSDVVHLLAIAPIESAPLGPSFRSKDGLHAGIELASTQGVTRLWFVIEDRRPAYVEMLDVAGERLAYSELSMFVPVEVRGRGDLRPEIATRVTIHGAAFEGEVRLTLYDPMNREFPTAAFSFEQLASRYGLETAIDLDRAFDPPVPGPQRNAPERELSE